MSYRIAFGGIYIESTTFTNYLSAKKDFRITRGQKLLNHYPWLNDIQSDIECIPLIFARAIPGGIVSLEFYNEWLSEFVDLIKIEMKKGMLDGILFDVHGAMSVEGMIDAEGTIAKTIRDIVGTELIISTTMDLHGNVSNLLFDSSDLLTCYRTAPHIDCDETSKRAFYNMIRVLNNDEMSFVKAKVDIPILLPGEKTSTEVEPGKGLYKELEVICQNSKIIDASIWMGFPWADQRRCHASIVLTGSNMKHVEKEIIKLAMKFWNNRSEFKFVGPISTSENSIDIALKSTNSPFFISDTGDNPGAGGSGDLNILLKKVIEINYLKKIEKKVLFSSIYDYQSIERIYNYDVGQTLSISLGGKVDCSFGSPLDIEVEITYLFDDEIAGKCAVVRNDNIWIIVTQNRFQYGTFEAYKRAGLNKFSDFDIIIVKMGYLEPNLSNSANGWVMAMTQGAVSQDLVNIKYKNLKRPIFPLDNFNFIPKIRIVTYNND